MFHSTAAWTLKCTGICRLAGALTRLGNREVTANVLIIDQWVGDKASPSTPYYAPPSEASFMPWLKRGLWMAGETNKLTAVRDEPRHLD
jgi:hypothetical protein